MEEVYFVEVKVKLDTPTNGALFAATCSQYAEDIDFHYGSIVLDAKSVISVMSTGLSTVCRVVMHTDDADRFNKFKEDIKMWIAEED